MQAAQVETPALRLGSLPPQSTSPTNPTSMGLTPAPIPTLPVPQAVPI